MLNERSKYGIPHPVETVCPLPLNSMETESVNFHASYPDIKRYWSSQSQRYAGGDNLLTALQRDWKIINEIYEEHFWHGGSRLVTVYHIELSKNDYTVFMPVITTPFVRRIIRGIGCKPLPIEERPAQPVSRYAGSR